MITQIKDLMVPPQPAQHLGSGLVGQCVSVSVSQHIMHMRADNLPPTHMETHIHCNREDAVLLANENMISGVFVGRLPAHPPRLHWLEQEC